MMLILWIFRIQKESGSEYLTLFFLEGVGLGFIYSLSNYLSSCHVHAWPWGNDSQYNKCGAAFVEFTDEWGDRI